MKEKMLVVVLGVLVSIGAVSAFTIDGDLSDWGVDLSGDWSLNETWVPNGGIYFKVEDNQNPLLASTYTGVHIEGWGASYHFYNEPKVMTKDGRWVLEPFGGEKYDFEAIYLTQDADYIYVAIVTSNSPEVPPDHDYMVGDLGIDLNSDRQYEYGVKLGKTTPGISQFDIYQNPSWKSAEWVPDNSPTYFYDGTKIGEATGAYKKTVQDQGKDNWVIELAIPKSVLGVQGFVPYNAFHITDRCGNDHVPVPEFPTVLIPMLLVAGGYLGLRRRMRE